MLGLAMHRDTGRNIYLGALHLGVDIPNPDNLILAPAPKAMEYRVVARRTSIRSLLGNMLLQSEVANAMSPSADTIDFADALLSTIQGSLYAGDSFVLELDESGKLSASLNGATLIDRTDNGVFDYLLTGWTGQNSPSTAFRSEITNTDIDSSLLSAYSAHTPTDERISLVSEWSHPLSSSNDHNLLVEIVPVTRPVKASVVVVPAVVASADTTIIEAPEVTAAGGSASDAGPGNSAEISGTEQSGEELLAFDIDGFQTDPDGSTNTIVQVSAAPTIDESIHLAPESELTPEVIAGVRAAGSAEQGQEESFDILSLDLTEYSHRLASFNSALIKLVYSQIKYPRRAVRRDIQGALELDITVSEDGSLVEVVIAESSGYSILDVAAVEAAQNALERSSLGEIDPVAVAEYSLGSNLVIPVPVNFILQ
ncbi:MAG: energy transducer TonB [Halioglobus sp.]